MLADIVLQLVVELIRSLLIEGLVERARGVRFPRGPRGIEEVRRHVHRGIRKRLLNRLSTELSVKKPLSAIFPYLWKSTKLLQ